MIIIYDIIQSISKQFNIPIHNITCNHHNNGYFITVKHPEGLTLYDDMFIRCTDEPLDYMVYTQLEPKINSLLKFDRLITYIINYEGLHD